MLPGLSQVRSPPAACSGTSDTTLAGSLRCYRAPSHSFQGSGWCIRSRMPERGRAPARVPRQRMLRDRQVITDQCCLLDPQRIQQIDDVFAQGRLLARAENIRRAEDGRSKAAKVRHNDAIAGGGQRSADIVVTAWIERPAM